MNAVVFPFCIFRLQVPIGQRPFLNVPSENNYNQDFKIMLVVGISDHSWLSLCSAALMLTFAQPSSKINH